MPILKWKRGEQLALQQLSAIARQGVLPIIEVQDRPYDWDRGEEGGYTKTWVEHLRGVVESTAKYCGADLEVAVDQPMEIDDLAAPGRTAWSFLFESLWQSGVRAIPVISSLASTAEIKTLGKLGASRSPGRFVLRFACRLDSINGLVDDAGEWFRDTLKRLGAIHSNVDVVLDLGYIGGEFQDSDIPNTCSEALLSVALQGPWRSVTLAAGSFPENLAHLRPGVSRLPRRDWELYAQTRRMVVDKRLRLAFSDYGITYTSPLEANPRLLRMSANLRYTSFDDWVVFKARSVKDHGYEQYRELCRLLVNSEGGLFMGSKFSAGDKNYFKVANDNSVGPGNATTWRRDATNHHIHTVLRQLETFDAPSRRAPEAKTDW